MEILENISVLFHKGGFVMYPLLLCSVVVVAIAIERYGYYRNSATKLDVLLAELEQPLKAGDWQQALSICQSHQGAAAGMLAQALRRVGQETYILQNTMEGAAGLAAAKLRDKINYLDTIITLAPLLGLLGTVIGMINAFSIMSIKAGQPHAITGGVGEALVATATGLCVAVLALVVHSYFSHWLEQIITDMEQAGTFLIDMLQRGETK